MHNGVPFFKTTKEKEIISFAGKQMKLENYINPNKPDRKYKFHIIIHTQILGFKA